MRTTDPDPQPFKPLGEKVIPPAKPNGPEWQPLPNHPGVEINREGKVRTQIPLPPYPRWFP